MRKSLYAVLTAALLSPVALAQGEDTLAIYTALARLKANLGEMSASLAMHALSGGEGAYAEAYDEDEGGVYGFLRALERLDISDDLRGGVEAFRDEFGEIEDEGEVLLEADLSGGLSEEQTAQLTKLYSGFGDLAATIDGYMVELEEANSVVLDTARDEE